MPLPSLLPFPKSTIVRSTAAQGNVQALVRLLARFAPLLAARAGESLFFRPMRNRRPEAETLLLAAAERSSLTLHGRRLAVARWGAGPAVLLVHGWSGRGSQLASFVRPLLDSGFSVLTFDAPAHGDSQGRTTNLLEFADAIQRVAAWAGGVEALVGHSLGAAACVLTMTRGLDVKAVVLIGAPARPSRFFAGFLAELGVPAEAAVASRRRVAARLGIRWEDLDVVTQAPHLAASALIIHDRADAEVPWRDAAEIAAAWGGSDLLVTEGLGHRRILRDPLVTARAATFLTRCVRPGLPGQGNALERDLFDRDARRREIFAGGALLP